MRFPFKSIIIVGLLIWGLSSCGTNESSKKISFDNVAVSKDIALSKGSDSPRCRISINVNQATGNDSRAKAVNAAIIEKLFYLENLTVRQAVDSFANEYARNYTETLAKLYKEDKDVPERRPWYEYNYTLNTEVKEGRTGVMVYIASLDYFEGGAHGINQKIVMNFDAETGKMLSLADILVPGYESRLNEILLSSLEEKVGVKGIDKLHEKGYLYSMNIFTPDNFILGDEGITFIYNVYEIAPYSKGLTELNVSYSDINDLLPQ